MSVDSASVAKPDDDAMTVVSPEGSTRTTTPVTLGVAFWYTDG